MESKAYDVVVIGGGIIGLSTAMQIKLDKYPDWRVAVVEKDSEIANHQTGHNSGVIHSGIYYRPDSHKARFCVGGAKSLRQFCDENEIEYNQCGKVIVATNDAEIGRLQTLHERGIANGVDGLEIIGPERLKELEPHVTGVQALWAPTTGIVDYRKVSAAYAEKFQQAGGDVFTNAPVSRIIRTQDELVLETPGGAVHTKHIINCAGLYAARVAEMMGEDVDIQIVPFRGEYYTLRPESHHLVNGLIYPVPDPRFPFLGVHFTRNIHGYVEAGPNAVLALKREGYRKSDVSIGESFQTFTYPGFWKMLVRDWRTGLWEINRSLRKSVFLASLQSLVPELTAQDLAGAGSGVRAQAVDRAGNLLDDFRIEQAGRSIHVLNAPYPGATSSLVIGQHVAELAASQFSL